VRDKLISVGIAWFSVSLGLSVLGPAFNKVFELLEGRITCDKFVQICSKVLVADLAGLAFTLIGSKVMSFLKLLELL